MTEHAQPRLTEHVDEQGQREWHRFVRAGVPQLISNHNFVHALFGFTDSGMAARMEKGARTVDEIVAGGNRPLAEGLLRYLQIREVVRATPDHTAWSLTELGHDLVCELSAAQVGFYREAYGAVFDSLSPMLTGKRKYGSDVQRDGEALGRHSADGFRHFGRTVTMRALDSLGAQSFLDLGCGAAGFLIDAVRERPQMRGIGLDISAEAIDVARERVAEAKLSDRIHLHVGDAFRPETWPDECRRADAILTVGTLHEQFRDGEGAVLALLEEYAKLMHASAGEHHMKGLVLGEPEVVGNSADADFYLLHVATLQGMPRPRDEWLALFERSALRCDEVLVAVDLGPSFAYYVLRPR